MSRRLDSDGLRRDPNHSLRHRNGPIRDAWFYEDRNGIDVVVEGDSAQGCAATVSVRIPWASIASYARRRLRRSVLVFALLLAVPLAAQELPGEPADQPVSAEADAPTAFTDRLRDSVAAVVYCPVRTSKREEPAAVEGDEPTADGPGCGAGVALRLMPRHWRRLAPGEERPPTRWAGGLFLGAHEFGPFVAFVALRLEEGAVGFGVGARIPFDSEGVDLGESPRLVFGVTASLAALRGGE